MDSALKFGWECPFCLCLRLLGRLGWMWDALPMIMLDCMSLIMDIRHMPMCVLLP